jgi:hypothetical protein
VRAEHHQEDGALVFGSQRGEVIGPGALLSRVDAGLDLDEKDADRNAIEKEDDDIDAALGGKELAKLARTEFEGGEEGESDATGVVDEFDGDPGVGAEEFDQLFVGERGHGGFSLLEG